MNQPIRLLFWLYKSKINNKGLAPIFLRLTISGLKTEISTGVSIPLKSWDSKKSVIKGASTEVKELNKSLEALKNKALKAYNGFVEQDIPVSVEQIKACLIGQTDQPKTLLHAINYHNDMLSKKVGLEVSKATYTKYQTLKKHITNFLLEHFKRKDMFLRELNYQFVSQFEMHLKTKCRISHNPTMKYIQLLKTVVHLAVANDWLQTNPFKSFKCSIQVKERGYLTAEELIIVQAKQITISRLKIVRDMFVLSCYTGLAYADIKKLSSQHLITQQDGSRWIVLNRTKTEVRSAIPLLPTARQILDLYEPPFVPDNITPLLPVLSNQKMNAYLKEIGDICGITKSLTFHLARHTFATTVTLTNGVPIESVSKMLGHTNLKTTQHYAKVVDTKIKHDMLQLQTKFAVVTS